MRRIVFSRVCTLLFALVLAGCELWGRLTPWISDGDGDPSEPVDTVTIERGSTFELLGRGHALSASTQGLRILDVRDPRAPRVEGTYPIGLYTPAFYRMGEHVILAVDFASGYLGARDDLPLDPDRDGVLLNIDIQDRAHPRLVNEIQLDDLPRLHLMRRAPEGDVLFVLTMHSNGEGYKSRVERYELRDGTLVGTGQLMLDAVAEAVDATPSQLLVATHQQYTDQFRVYAIDTTGPELTSMFSANAPGRIGPPAQMIIDHEQLRVSHLETTGASAITTFDLTSPTPHAPIGHCALGSASFFTPEARLFSSYASSFFLSNGELERLSFDDAGNCTAPTRFGMDSRSYALQELGPTRLLALGSDALSLYDSAEATNLARAALAAPVATAERPIQLSKLPTPAAASDGTPEPVLISVPYLADETQSRFQLLTLSDHTLTARANITQRGFPQATALFGRTLLTVTSTELHAFDVRNLDQPRSQGQLELAESYPYVFSFGDYIARIRRHPWVMVTSLEERALRLQDDLQVLRRSPSGAWEAPISSLPVESVGEWVQVGSVLANLQLSVADYGTREHPAPTARISIQAYDLSDPTRPRKAGQLSTTEIEAEWTGGHFTEPYIRRDAVGGALIIPQPKRFADDHVRVCWKEIEYNACPASGMPDCKKDYYSGLMQCRRINAEPEVCQLLLTHCTVEKCESLSELPDGIPTNDQGCTESDQPGQATTFAFNVIDLRDPDRPTLVRPAVTLPGADQRQEYFVSGAKIYATERAGDATQYATELDFSDPLAPTLSARHVVPGEIVATTPRAVYAASGVDALTLSRVPWGDTAPQPGAARTWPDRELVSLTFDAAGHPLLLHHLRRDATPSPDAQANWIRLELLDAQSLTTLGALAIDESLSDRTALSDGRLLINGSGAAFLVDIRNASRPQLQATLPHGTGPSLFEHGQVILSDELGFRSYPADLQNLSP